MRNFDPCVHRFKKLPPPSQELERWNTERKNMLNGLNYRRNVVANHQNLKRLFEQLSALKRKGLEEDEFTKEHERIRKLWMEDLNLEFTPKDFFEFYNSRSECISRFKGMWRDVLLSMRELNTARPELLFFFPASHGLPTQSLRSTFQLRQNRLHGFSSYTLWFYHQQMVDSPADMNLWFRDYLERRNEVQRIFAPYLESDLVFHGYKDVTSSIISGIYEKYPSLEWMIKIIQGIYEEWKKQ